MHIKKMVTAALLAALGVLLPVFFHSIPQAGAIFLPMHLPVLLCGLLCGAPYGLLCGILAPLASFLITGMPPMAILPAMLCELATYGLVAGLLTRLVRGKNSLLGLYFPLVGAMLCGRIVAGLVNGFLFQAGTYSLQAWLTASFVTSLPGIAIQLVLLPALIFALQKARVWERTHGA